MYKPFIHTTCEPPGKRMLAYGSHRPIMLFRFRRHPTLKRAALAGLARDLDVAAHHGEKAMADGEAEPRAAVLARRRSIRLGEWLKQAFQLLGGHADAGIGDDEAVPGPAVRRLRISLEPYIALMREFARIAEQIQQDLAQLRHVDLQHPIRHHCLQRVAAALH